MLSPAVRAGDWTRCSLKVPSSSTVLRRKARPLCPKCLQSNNRRVERMHEVRKKMGGEGRTSVAALAVDDWLRCASQPTLPLSPSNFTWGFLQAQDNSAVVQSLWILRQMLCGVPRSYTCLNLRRKEPRLSCSWSYSHIHHSEMVIPVHQHNLFLKFHCLLLIRVATDSTWLLLQLRAKLLSRV